MTTTSKVVLFGDQTVDPCPLIKQLCRQSTHSLILQSFFQRSYSAIRQELAISELSDRSRFPSFDSILALAEAHSQSIECDEAVSSVLLCLAQLGLLLSREENNENLLDTKSFSTTYLVGLCTGMLPAAALAFSSSTTQLLELAPEIVRISLRLGLEASRRSEQIEKSHKSWATVVPGVPLQEQREILHRFHHVYAVPTSKRAYISAESEFTTTISGPPSTLASLFSFSETLGSTRKISLPINAPFHAPHLGDPDTSKITGSSSSLNEYKLRKDVIIISTSTGEEVRGRSLGEVLQQIVWDVLREPLRWSTMTEGIASKFRDQDAVIISVGPVRAANSLRREMTNVGVNVVDSYEMQPLRTSRNRNTSGDIAIVGVAGRLPGGESLEEIWKNLEEGKDLHKEIPKDRFDVDTHYDPSGKIKNTSVTPYGCFLDRPGFFDARLFNMSPREAAQTDPAQRLLLLTTYEALEMSGYTPNGSASTASDRIGTFFGQTLDDYREANASQNIEMYFVSGGMRAFGPGRLNYHFKWEGPSYCVDAACSSSALSVQMAMSSLRAHECDTAVAGGTNVLTAVDMFSGLSRGSFLSPTGSCKTFDDEADGYCRGDGVGSLVLKRLEDAIAEGDNIQAVIKSAATNHSAHAISITHPHAGTQQKLIRQVLREADVEPEEIDYVEMHGTGTQAGDATEFTSVTKVLSNRTKDNPLHVGAVKANFGHAEAAAGTNSLIKILLMMRKNAIPPHVGIKGRINQKFPPLDEVNVRIDRALTAFKAHARGDGKRRVLLNNFNATGGNTSLVLEDPPETFTKGEDPRKTYVVAVSAKTAKSFTQNQERLLAYIESNPETQLQDLSYTTTARRMHHDAFRKGYAVESLDQLVRSMKKDLTSSSEPPAITRSSPVIFAFTGQGAQYLDMGRQLFETNSSFRQSILDFDRICISQGLPSFKWLVTGSSSHESVPSPSESQLALVSIGVALASLWQSWGITPTAVIGHSLGEYAALCVAGVLSVSDTLYLVGKRAETMEKRCIANSHAMLAVQSGSESIQQIISAESLPSCEIACFNGPNNTTVSGAGKEINLLAEKLDEMGVKRTLLELPFAFHSEQMDPILEDIRAIASNVDFLKPTVPIASTLLGSLVRDEGIVTADYLSRQARQPVRFQEALYSLRSEGTAGEDTLWIEVGAHPLCHGMVRSTLGMSPSKALPSLRRDEDCWSTISKSISNAFNSGAKIMWTEYHRDFRGALKLLELPSYAFDLKNYWIQHEGDWSLRKGDTTIVKTTPTKEQPDFSTTCLQRVESEKFTQDSASVTFSSRLAEPSLHTAVRGHLVNNIGLCPSSVYADVAFTAAWYIASRMAPSDPVPAMDLTTMEVFRPLIVDKETSQVLKVSASRKPGEQVVKIQISSEDLNGSHDHANCTVMYGNGQQWMDEWRMNAYLVESRMDQLIRPINPASVHRLLKEMIYKQFQTVVTYSKEYHNIDEIFMDCELNETAANIRFQPTAGNGNFTYSPYWIDTVAHLAGFVLNASTKTPADTVFISHGWQSFRIAAPLSDEKTYRGYVRMQPIGTRGVMAGDVYIFDGEQIVVVCKGIKFQKMKRNVLHSLLSTGREEAPTPRLVSTKRTLQNPVIETKAATVPSTRTSSGGFSKILETIASEVGIEVSDLTDDAKVSDLGVDSLLTISILGRLRPETGLDLPSSLFIAHPTVAELRDFFLDKVAPSQSVADDEDRELLSPSASNTPRSSASHESLNTMTTTPAEPDTVAILMSIIAREVGIDATEIQPSTQFADLGVDSLLTISILDAFKSEMRMSLAATFFHENPTFTDVQKALGVPSAPHRSPPTPAEIPDMSIGPSKQSFRSKSVLLQGRPSPNHPALFLLPDGAGSLFSYISLPTLPSGVAVYGLDSPFLASPKDYTVPFDEVASIFIKEIRAIQPQGPYMLGGWSLGGILAFEASRQLIAQGETVTHLILIDSPCPGTLPPLPSPTLGLLEKAGIFEGLGQSKGSTSGAITERTRLHFLGSVRALENYTAKPIPADRSPGKVTVIWAHDGVLEGREDTGGEEWMAGTTGDAYADMAKAKQWLTGKRTSFGPSGWDNLTGTEVQCHVVGGNHFSIMFPPLIEAVGVALATGLPT